MTKSTELLSQLKKGGLNFFVSVPCKYLNELIQLLEKDTEVIYTPVTREEEGVGVVAGAYLAGKKPAIILQNSGLGNSINAICSLLNYYQIPIVFVVSHRGSEGEIIAAQRPMGDATEALLDSVNINSYVIKQKPDLNQISNIIDAAYKRNQSVALLFPITFWK
jgi:sulfopyruvate decarboxylase subunit alpha